MEDEIIFHKLLLIFQEFFYSTFDREFRNTLYIIYIYVYIKAYIEPLFLHINVYNIVNIFA